MRNRLIQKLVALGALVALFVATMPQGAGAQSVEELQAKIKERNDKIRELEEEIKQHQVQIQAVGREANTLQSAIKTLDANGKKLTTELKLTETSIDKTVLAIDKLSSEIGDLEHDIEKNNAAIAMTIREMYVAENSSMIETLLLDADFSTLWTDIDTMSSFQDGLRSRIEQLRQIQLYLQDKISETEKQRSELVNLKSSLSDKKKLVDQNKQQKSSLLTQTKSKEAEYKRLLAEKAAQRAAFEKELFNYEAQLQMVIDKTKIAPAGKGVLSWPLDNVRITQYFGRTVDAQRLYSSGTHNGIDLGVSRGTAVKSARAGVVKGTGNTDAQPGCYSYGKWVLIEHDNGLSTLYAHLDLISVSSGQTVATGQVIGYSGATGYATGPHLHFTVYASQGVVVQRYAHSINCQQVSIPIADQKAYLDPMLYLP